MNESSPVYGGGAKKKRRCTEEGPTNRLWKTKASLFGVHTKKKAFKNKPGVRINLPMRKYPLANQRLDK